MLSIKNVSGETKTWGGLIFENNQERTIDTDTKKELAASTCFYQCILDGEAQVIIDGILEENVILACEFIRFETKKDYEGNVFTRSKQVPDDYHRQHKYVQFRTSDSTSLVEKRWINTDGNECSLIFQKIVDGQLTTCQASEATITSIKWDHPWNTMPNYAEAILESIDSNITAFIGSYGIEQYDQGKIAYGISFALNNKYTYSVVEPRLLPYPLIMHFVHPAGYQKKVEVFFEFFTDFKQLET
jgi:hypothetical protein